MGEEVQVNVTCQNILEAETFGLFAPQPVASIAGALIIVTQGWLVLSGNFSWLNAVTITLATASLDDARLGKVLRIAHPHLHASPLWWEGLAIAVAAAIAVLSWWPVQNLLGRHRRQRMNYSFNSLHLVNAYGAFGHITKVRYEIVFEGTDDITVTQATVWREYEFKGKPGDLSRMPPQVAPYHLRLDWLMWFAAMSAPSEHPWFEALLEKLLDADPAVLSLLRVNPFPDRPPRYVRARLYRYSFTTPEERARTGQWWRRDAEGLYFPAVGR